VVAATLGNALEFYDFLTYVFFSIQIGHAFFPSHSAYASLMLSLATFGAGFVTRPLGAIVIGAYSDRAGRRPAMMLSMSLMGAAILGMALIPTYRTIGAAAPLLAVLARMVQGFSFGGEVGPTTAYLLEAAPLNRRGLVVSWQGASQGLAGLAASLIGVGLTNVLAPSALDAYGWRIAFLIGAVTLPFALWIRRNLPETLHTPEPAAPASRATTRLGLAGEHRRIIGLTLTAAAAGSVGTYVFFYLTTFAQNTLHIPARAAFLAQAAGSLAGVISVLVGGWLSDKVGRRPVMIWPNLLYLILLIPVFDWIIASRSAFALIVGAASLHFVSQMTNGAFYAAVTESLPKPIRGGAFAIAYALALTIFGGTTQLVVTWLIHTTGNPMAPAWYVVGATCIGQIAFLLIRESAPAKAAQIAG